MIITWLAAWSGWADEPTVAQDPPEAEVPHHLQVDAVLRQSPAVLACIEGAYARNLLVAKIDVAFDVAADASVSHWSVDAAEPDEAMLLKCLEHAVVTETPLPAPPEATRITFTWAWDHSDARGAKLSMRFSSPAGPDAGPQLSKVRAAAEARGNDLAGCLLKHDVPAGQGATLRFIALRDGSLIKAETRTSSGSTEADACLLGVIASTWVDGVSLRTKVDLDVSWLESQ